MQTTTPYLSRRLVTDIEKLFVNEPNLLLMVSANNVNKPESFDLTVFQNNMEYKIANFEIDSSSKLTQFALLDLHTEIYDAHQIFVTEQTMLSNFLDTEVTSEIYSRLIIGAAYAGIAGKTYWEDSSLNMLDNKSFYYRNRSNLFQALSASKLNPFLVSQAITNGMPVEMLEELEASNLAPSWILSVSETFLTKEFINPQETIFSQLAYGRKITK